MNKLIFQVLKKDKCSNARLGVLTTLHGIVKTPAYVIVATRGEIKTLKPSDIKKTKTQIVISNTYHLWPEAIKIKNLEKQSFITERLLEIKLPTMTDSGGFQVFSLAFGRHDKAGKIFPQTTETQKKTEKAKRRNIRITDKGVYFKSGNKWRFLGPELSIKIQEKLGADIIFAFDECTSFFDDFKYNRKAMERTHKWALTSLKVKIKNEKLRKRGKQQMLFGIVQGGRYKQLRVQSAKFIGSLPFDGFGIGGSFGKEEMAEMLRWIIPNLPEEKPRHLLGIGRIEDIFRAVENGVDLFDCVIPTREARHGRIWTAKNHYYIRKLKFSKDKEPLEKGCKCPACKTTTRAEIHKLFKNPKKLTRGQRLTTIHNVYFFNDFVEKIRDSIARGKFIEFKNKILNNL